MGALLYHRRALRRLLRGRSDTVASWLQRRASWLQRAGRLFAAPARAPPPAPGSGASEAGRPGVQELAQLGLGFSVGSLVWWNGQDLSGLGEEEEPRRPGSCATDRSRRSAESVGQAVISHRSLKPVAVYLSIYISARPRTLSRRGVRRVLCASHARTHAHIKS
jgi:hypothetical protein